MRLILALHTGLCVIFLFGACAPKVSDSSSVTPMVPYCSTVTSYSGSTITLSGTANYESRVISGVCTSGAPCTYTVSGANPIRRAEVRVTDAAGNITQCGQTDGSGGFSVVVPQSSSTNYTLTVASRANNSYLEAYVMTNPTDNAFYSLSTTVSGSASNLALALLATSASSGTRIAGAFNILDQLLNANLFLQAKTVSAYNAGTVVGGCGNGAYFSDCTNFSVGPIVYAYWSKGVNPATYYGSSSPISFYLPGESKLFILGGSSGVVDTADTDEFDNSVIIHEYGHFMEDHYGKSDSPGGSHDGNSIIDPRLAWSEGWADFFQAAVTGVAFYRDTRNKTSTTGYFLFNESVETGSLDLPATAGEGTFREFSVTRALWDIIDNVNDGETVHSPFAELWAVFTGSTYGLRNSSYAFRNVSLLHKVHASAPGANWTDWSSVQTNEKQTADLSSYGASLTSAGCATSNLSIDPTTTYNLHLNDRFYRLDVAATTAYTFSLMTLSPTANKTDLDIYIMSSDYTYSCDSGCSGANPSLSRTGILAYAANSDTYSAPTDPNCAEVGLGAGCSGTYSKSSETVSVTLSPGTYMISVGADPYQGGATLFSLKLNGTLFCAHP